MTAIPGIPALRVTPFGLDECCICDAPATLAARDEGFEGGEFLPYCLVCAADLKDAFPSQRFVSIVRET